MGDRTSAWTCLSAVLAFRSSSERVGHFFEELGVLTNTCKLEPTAGL
jgi:hypothetical protein